MAVSTTPFALLNSIAQVTLNGLASDADGRLVSLNLQRRMPPPVAPEIHDFRPREGGPPERLPSQLPAPGDLSATFSLTDAIDYGRVGSVRGVSLLDCSSPAGLPYALPPLVIKIARRSRSQELEREAWFYEEMESLQGVALARCYGLFQVELEHSIHIESWNVDDEDTENEGPTEAGKSCCDCPRVLSILLLERLGERMPFGEPTPDGAREDMYDMYSDMAELGINHNDIRWQNFLRAPASPPGLPSLPSPYKHRTYAWRAIDFDNSEKNDYQFVDNEIYFAFAMRRIFYNIPFGYVVEPWEI
ncbi:hypothetical protein PLICRDRAFT_344255 [Plicaturopsis crispa FD-325 SS-3]|uniref:Unplaced genomic scaffold PLICRscaffold_16, whole genome shotgun sequence n=1 Tax=Plicaturopsis crispa FD-325 SS-3 TaxID=944288 RepID=A0A0C9SRN7_PLICR|nr:hypothetical protein PLICRDRAFT_344255 [Plicaturopsis crispa FD-325 SS-3]